MVRIVGLFVLTLSFPLAAAAQQDASLDAQLLQLERELAGTLGTRAQDIMQRLLAPDFVLRGAPDVDRATWITEALARCWGDRFDIDDFSARVAGDTAITSFQLTFFVNPETCAPGVLRSLITDVWIRDGDSWRLRVRHSSPPPSGGVAAQFGLVPQVPPRWVLQSELSFVSTGGNTSTRTVGLASDLTRQTDRVSSRLQLSYVSSEADDVTNARATSVQARHGLKLRPTLEVFGRVGYTRDLFAGIDHRAAFESGLAWNTGRPPRHRLALEAAAGYTTEDRVAAGTLRFAAGTGAARYAWQIRPGAELQDDLAVTADLSDADNWRATNGLSVTFALTRLLSLRLANAVEYRNLPVAGFRRTDVRTSAAVVVTLRRAP